MRRRGRRIGRYAALHRAARDRDDEMPTIGRAWCLACIGGVGLLAAAMLAGDAAATPLDLSDLRPRIEVRFEVSPRRARQPRPDLGCAAASAAEPIPGTGRVSIRVPAQELEAQLRSTGTDAVKGSFTDFLWTLDPVTGHVRSAGFSGRVHEHLRLGPIRTRAAIDIRVDMDTENVAGFVPSAGFLGIRTHRFCRPEPGGVAGCIAVQPIRFDPRRGYVNAVGRVRAAHALAEVTAFSPLGEVEFRERGEVGTESARSGPSPREGVCSDRFDRPCPVDGGDT